MSGTHAIILTFNEEQHLARCIEGIASHCDSVTVVDSGSTDRTVTIARGLGATVLVNPWTNYATQINYAIDALAPRGGWLLRIDADEVLDRDSHQSLEETIRNVGQTTAGILVQRRIYFMGRRIKHGGIEPSWQLRLWRNGSGRCEQRWMDEHIKVEGDVEKSSLILSDINLNSLSWWIAKHNHYASREAVDILNLRYGFLPRDGLDSANASEQAKLKRFVKEKVYLRLPTGLRALGYFLYRYVFRRGFLDGGPGYYFHTLQGFWYRTLVDAKVAEIEAHTRREGLPIIEAIKCRTGLNLVREHPTAIGSRRGADLPLESN